MRQMSEFLDMQVRGEDVRPNHRNKTTVKRRNHAKMIISQAGGDPKKEYAISMGILGDHVNRLQEYVISHSEEPAPNTADLVRQVAYLRKHEAKEAAEVLDFSGEDGRVFLEQQEDEFERDNGYKLDGFLGDLGAPIDIASAYLEAPQPEGFAATGLIGGLVNMIGTKINSAELKRAAQGKGANTITGLSTGGKAHYNALVAYFKTHPDIRQKVLNGEITEEDQLPEWTPPNQGADIYGRQAVGQFAQPYVDDQVKRYIPFIIGGVIVLILIIVLIVSRSKK